MRNSTVYSKLTKLRGVECDHACLSSADADDTLLDATSELSPGPHSYYTSCSTSLILPGGSPETWCLSVTVWELNSACEEPVKHMVEHNTSTGGG